MTAARLAFLHTSPVHVETFERLVKAADPSLTIEHRVVEELLADASVLGADDPALVRRVQAAMVEAASATGAAWVVCTCSTVGGAAERTPTGGRFQALRIDRPMADRAVRLGPRILVVAAIRSTLAPTSRLLRESVSAQGVDVDILPLLVEHAWPLFQRSEHAAYLAAVATAVRAHVDAADVVVLAQASMAPACDALQDLPTPVLASPSLGVQYLVERLRA